MIPITRKELYLNKIVGNDDYSVPEKPISEEEFFFAEILGEAVQAPEPLTRYQMYLAKIAGHNIEIPTPITRLEHFLAKVCGMDIETPTPITREEFFWSNYSAIVDFEVEGVPPLTYKAKKAGTLIDYRIYGAEGNVGNLRPSLVAATDFTNGYHVATDGTIGEHGKRVATLTPIDVSAINTIYVNSGINTLSNPVIIYSLFSDDTFIERLLVNGIEIVINTEGANKLYLSFGGESKVTTANLNNVYVMDNDKMYVIPVTVSNGTDTQTIPIYIPEQIRKVGDEAEYISYTDHKLHRVGAEDIDVNLPELPTLAGTNILSVGTEVQPSGIEIKGRIQEVTP